MSKIRERFKSYLKDNTSASNLTIAACLGIYIAFSPFIGFHTLMTIVFSWVFSLNFFVMFGISTIINNPWTMAFVYGADYLIGYWILTFLGIDPGSLNPTWISSLNVYIYHYTGLSGLSFGAFMIGGNVLGVVLAFLFYPILYSFFRSLLSEITGKRTDKESN